MSYNIKVIEYVNSVQIRVYSELQNNFDIVLKKARNPFDGELVRDLGVGEITYNAEESKRASLSRTKRKIREYARSFCPNFFVTLTYSPKMVNRLDYDNCIKKFLNWISNQRRRFSKDLKYLAVYEEHANGGIHFHMLLENIGDIKIKYSGKIKNGKKIYNVVGWKFGHSVAIKINADEVERTTSYITKYLVKNYESANFKKHARRFFASKNISKPIVTTYFVPPSEIEDVVQQIIDSTGKEVSSVYEAQGYYVDVRYIELL